MASSIITYDLAYLTGHKRSELNWQESLPESLVQLKERYFALAQAWFITRMVELVEQCPYDVAIIKPGLPYLSDILRKNGISTITIDNQPDLVTRIESRYGIPNGDLVLVDDFDHLGVPDKSVGISISHNLMQKLDGIEAAIVFAQESMRIATDFAYIQITDGNNKHYYQDDSHRLQCTIKEWEELLHQAVKNAGDGWKLREIHKPKVLDFIDIQRPPVFILERESHSENKRSLALNYKTALTRMAYEEFTTANMLSLARPALAHYGMSNLIEQPLALAMIMAAAFATDALDGMAARRFNKGKFNASRTGAYIDILADRSVELESLWAYANHGLIHPAIPVIFTAKGAVVDSLRIYRDMGKHDFSQPLLYGSNDNRYERAVYGVTKAIYISGVPMFLDWINGILGVGTAGFGMYRGLKSVLDSKTKKAD